MTCIRLKQASVDLWRGRLRVHPEENAGSIMEWFGEVEPHLGPHKVEELIEYPKGRTEHIIAANWKIVVENYIDGYHLAHLHSGTLAMYDHSRIRSGFVGPHFAFWEPPTADYAGNIEGNAPYPLVIPPEQAGAWVPMLFPGIGLTEAESSWTLFHVTPLAPDRTRVVTRSRLANAPMWAFARQESRSRGFWGRRITGKYEGDADDPMASGDFMAEDIHACEQQQKSLRSPPTSSTAPPPAGRPVCAGIRNWCGIGWKARMASRQGAVRSDRHDPVMMDAATTRSGGFRQLLRTGNTHARQREAN